MNEDCKADLAKFDEEIKTVLESYSFHNLLKWNPELERYHKQEIALAIHAFTVVDSALFLNPRVLGSYVQRVIEDPRATGSIVGAARSLWGAADFLDKGGEFARG